MTTRRRLKRLTKQALAELEAGLFPEPPEPSAPDQRLIDDYRELTENAPPPFDHEHEHILFRLSSIVERSQGYIRVSGGGYDELALHRIYAIIRIVELDRGNTYHVAYLRQFSEDDLLESRYARKTCVWEIRAGYVPGSYSQNHHVIRRDGTMSFTYAHDPRLYAKAMTAEPGRPFPFGSKTGSGRKTVTRLTPEQQSRFANRALYLVDHF